MNQEELRKKFEADNPMPFGKYYSDTFERYLGYEVSHIKDLNSTIMLEYNAKWIGYQAGANAALPDGYVALPAELTAENGAKSALSGEFHETREHTCPECLGDGSNCILCDDNGIIENSITISWTNIKAIHKRVVELFTEPKSCSHG